MRGTAPCRSASNTTSGVAPSREMLSTIGRQLERHGAARVDHERGGRESAAPLRTVRPSGKSMPLMRVWAVNGTSTAPATSGGTSPYWLDGEVDDRAPLRRLVGEAGQHRHLGELRGSSTPLTGTNSAAWREP